jgi:hypothetical protein
VRDPTAWLSAFDRLDAVLARGGFPATSPWWRAELERFIRSGRRRWVLRVGRRGGKSSTLCRVAVVQALAGGWSVPRGDVAVIPFVSLDRDEATGRIRTIGEILSTLGVAHDATADEITLPARRLRFSVKTCSVRSVGFTSVAVIGDEMARWTSRDDAANPAGEVMASLRPTLATQPEGFEVCSSSPWSTVDYHHELLSQGDNDDQVVSFAPTWLANPTLTEAETHRLEPDPRVWAREYAAIPSAELSACFDPALIGRCFDGLPEGSFTQPVAVIDPNSGGADAFTLGFACWATPYFNPPIDARCIEDSHWTPDGGRIVSRRYVRIIPGVSPCKRRITLPDGSLGWKHIPAVPSRQEPLDVEIPRSRFCLLSAEAVPSSFGRGDEIVDYVAQQCRRVGAGLVVGDQRESLFLETAFRERGLRYVSLAWTNANKAEAVRRIRRLMADGLLSLPWGEPLRRELTNYSERMTSSGITRYGARGSGHDDFVALLITATLADLERLLPGSPVSRPRSFRTEVPAA